MPSLPDVVGSYSDWKSCVWVFCLCFICGGVFPISALCVAAVPLPAGLPCLLLPLAITTCGLLSCLSLFYSLSHLLNKMPGLSRKVLFLLSAPHLAPILVSDETALPHISRWAAVF